MDQLAELPAGESAGREPEDAAHRGALVRDRSVAREHEDQVGAVLHQRAEVLAALLLGLLGHALLAVLDQLAQPARHPVEAVVERGELARGRHHELLVELVSLHPVHGGRHLIGGAHDLARGHGGHEQDDRHAHRDDEPDPRVEPEHGAADVRSAEGAEQVRHLGEQRHAQEEERHEHHEERDREQRPAHGHRDDAPALIGGELGHVRVDPVHDRPHHVRDQEVLHERVPHAHERDQEPQDDQLARPQAEREEPVERERGERDRDRRRRAVHREHAQQREYGQVDGAHERVDRGVRRAALGGRQRAQERVHGAERALEHPDVEPCRHDHGERRQHEQPDRDLPRREVEAEAEQCRAAHRGHDRGDEVGADQAPDHGGPRRHRRCRQRPRRHGGLHPRRGVAPGGRTPAACRRRNGPPRTGRASSFPPNRA